MKESENLYTFLFEYRDHKYISQAIASDPYHAILPWAKGLDYHKIKGIGNKTKELFITEVKSSLEDDLLVPLDDVKNIWGFGVISRGYGLIDLIKTETQNKKSGNSLFTFVLDFLGGTYISQIKAKTLDSAKLEWAKRLTSQEISGWRNSSKAKFVNQIYNFSLKTNPLSINVWNFDFYSGKNIGTVYCVKTEAT
jgi:hypothetical protein